MGPVERAINFGEPRKPVLSLRFKILAVAATLILLSQIGTVATVLVTANRDVSARATLALEAGSEIFQKTNQIR